MMHSSWRPSPDRPPGWTYDLDGQCVTDIHGFYCALGEAVHGPGGYFGWCYDALRDCTGRDFGATIPFTLRWHDSDVARQGLASGYDPELGVDRPGIDQVVDFLNSCGITLELR